MKWKKLQHNGIIFPTPFKSRSIKIRINNKEFKPNLLQEEMLYHCAKKNDTKYMSDKIFQKNFIKDLIAVLPNEFRYIKFSDIDFSKINLIIEKEKQKNELMDKDEKKELAVTRKKKREAMKEKYGKAIIDDKEVEVANYIAEPPSIFVGRGDHPLRGKWKPRIYPNNVTLNLGKEATIPDGAWGKVIHDRNSMWLASWKDHLTKKKKYVWLSDTSKIKQEREKAKYNKAAKLSKEINKIKKIMGKDMNDKNIVIKKIATVCYLIYRTAMRVGDEKDHDEVDTVGATTLRKEHIKLTKHEIKFDFLGKDSVRWRKTILISNEHDKKFYNNLKKLIENKKPEEEIFHDVTSRHVNTYYSKIVNGLTAKVFRTYLATNIVKYYLQKNNVKEKSSDMKLYYAKLANLEAAKMCNHKKTISKSFHKSLEKKREILKKIEEIVPKTKKQKERLIVRKEKTSLAIKLLSKTRDYNLSTSLRNYIDPRVYKDWADDVVIEWKKLYTSSLQKKFLWINDFT